MVAVRGTSAGADAATAAQQVARQPAKGGSSRPRSLEFLRDVSSGRVAVRATDSVTGEEIRCIPTVKMLAAIAGIRKAIGLLLDRKI